MVGRLIPTTRGYIIRRRDGLLRVGRSRKVRALSRASFISPRLRRLQKFRLQPDRLLAGMKRGAEKPPAVLLGKPMLTRGEFDGLDKGGSGDLSESSGAWL